MIELNRADYELILTSIVNDQKQLRDTETYLRRNGLANGDQIVAIQKRMGAIQLTVEKIEDILLAM